MKEIEYEDQMLLLKTLMENLDEGESEKVEKLIRDVMELMDGEEDHIRAMAGAFVSATLANIYKTTKKED